MMTLFVGPAIFGVDGCPGLWVEVSIQGQMMGNRWRCCLCFPLARCRKRVVEE